METRGRRREELSTSLVEKRDRAASEEDLASMTIAEDAHENLCSHCGDGGELICCDGCPAVLHPACAGEDGIPVGEFFCVPCRRESCGERGRPAID